MLAPNRWGIPELVHEELPTPNKNEQPLCSRKQNIHAFRKLKEAQAIASGQTIIPDQGHDYDIGLIPLIRVDR